MAKHISGEVSHGDVAGAISSYFGVAPGASGVNELLQDVLPEVKQAAAANPSSWKSVFPGVMAKYESRAKELGLGSPVQRDLDRMRNSNVTGSDFAGAVGRLEGVLGFAGLRMAALASGVASDAIRGEGRRSSADFNLAFNGGMYTASNLSGEMKNLVDPSRGISAAHVAGVGNYLTGLDINAQQYSGYFVGSSEGIRQAIQKHVKEGAKLTDDQIKNPKDVTAIIGAIKAGKIKKDDAPPSVQKIIDDMEKKGIDPAKVDHKVLDKYFKDNPKALEAAKAEVKARVDKETKAPSGGTTPVSAEELKASILVRSNKPATQSAPPAAAESKPSEKKTAATPGPKPETLKL